MLRFCLWRKNPDKQEQGEVETMGIWKKLEDALRANINDLLDRAVDPVKELNLMIDDLRDFRGKQVISIVAAIASIKIIKADLNETKESVARWAIRAKNCAMRQDEAGAKMALKQQIQQEKLADKLADALQTSEKQVEGLKADLAQLDDKIQYLESQRAIVRVRVSTAQAQKSIHGPISGHGSGPRADEILDRVEGKVRKMEAEAGAASEIADLAHSQTVEERFGESELDEEVEKRLAALKEAK
jgi:phage shock protein A